MSDVTKQELLDIRVLEMLQTPPSEGESAHGELLSTLAGADGITPSDSVLMSVVDAYLSDANSEKLSDLLLVLPLKSAAADRVYEHKISERLRRNYRERWVIGRRHEAIEEVLNCHQTVLEEDFHISDAALASLTTRLNNYIRLYIEVLMEEREKEKDPTSPAFAACLRAFQLIENKGRFIADVSKDYSVLINYWEALFFSPEFRSQEEADKMLEENPQVRNLIMTFSTVNPIRITCSSARSLSRRQPPPGPRASQWKRIPLPKTRGDIAEVQPGRVREDQVLRGIARSPM